MCFQLTYKNCVFTEILLVIKIHCIYGKNVPEFHYLSFHAGEQYLLCYPIT
uniref:Uncharacterized protein n=1 Tax=Anguilla anguilla TaxID=7936 RepID=A0A0E9WUM7_ANGAN